MFSGNNNPFGFIMLNSETTENDNGGVLTQLLDMSIFIITQNGINKMKEHCNVLYAAILYYADQNRAKIALKHQTGGYRLPKREHFGFNKTDGDRYLERIAKLQTVKNKKANR